jgi:glycosyltransferase involved in cell wall biosynthesis
MRILYFSRDCTPHDHRFLSALAKTEHQVYFLRLEKGIHMLEDRPLPGEIEQVEWMGGKHPVKLYEQLLLLGDLRRVIQKIKPDLVQAGPIQRTAFLVALAGFQPLVAMSWGYDLLHDARINPFWSWATRYTLRHSASFVGDCATIRQLAISYGMPDEHIVTFPWGVDINHFNVGTLERLNARPATVHGAWVETFKLLSTRGFEPIYGVDVIARAFVIAARKNPSLHLTLLGSGSQEAALHQVFKFGGVAERVEFKGKISYDDLPPFYHQADVYISASHSDGSSISLLEAFACGTPAIVSDIPGNCEWVTPGENGWLFPDGDASALAERILEAANQRHRLSQMGSRARFLAERRADWEQNFTKLENAYAIAMKQPSLPGVAAG